MADLLQNFRGPGLIERIAGAFFGRQLAFDSIQIEVSSHCGGKCDYCPHSRPEWRPKHMQPETFAKLWPALRSARRAHLQGWGEPLLNPHFFEFQKLAQKAGCQTSTTTCGLNITPELASKIAQSGMDIVAISLAGTDSASNACRANVPFERVCESLRIMRSAIESEKSGLELHIAYLLLADRMESVLGLPDLMEKYGVRTAVISTLDYIAAPEHRALAILPEDSAKLNQARELLEQTQAAAKGKEIYFDLPGEAGDIICHENPFRCFYVDADGFVSPCIYLNVQGDNERRVMGNVQEKSPLQIWQGLEFENFRNQLGLGNPGGLCSACAKRYA